MACRTIGSIVVALMLSTISPQTQPTPTFTGRWTVIPDKTRLGGNGGCPGGARGLGQDFTAAQTSKVLTIERMQGPPANPTLTTSTYRLDGSESRNPMPAGEAISKASWDGQKLTISTTSVFDTGGGDVPTVTMKTTQVLSLDTAGLLSVVTTVSCRNHAPETTTMIYKKEG